MNKLEVVTRDENDKITMVAWHCPGCGCGHAVAVNGFYNSGGATWQWNGDCIKPTFTPSILCNESAPEFRCHSFVRDGMQEFLADCYHELKGQTVEIPAWEDW